MAFLDILNIPALLGRETHSFKRANLYDRLDLGLAAVVGIIGSLVLLLNGFSSPLSCVPASCAGGSTNPSCALDWSYQSGQCRAEVLSTPDSSFHFLLVGLSLLLTGLLAAQAVQAQFNQAPREDLFIIRNKNTEHILNRSEWFLI